EDDRGFRVVRSQLHDAPVVACGEVGVEPPAELLVERLCAIDVGNAEHHDFELHVEPAGGCHFCDHGRVPFGKNGVGVAGRGHLGAGAGAGGSEDENPRSGRPSSPWATPSRPRVRRASLACCSFTRVMVDSLVESNPGSVFRTRSVTPSACCSVLPHTLQAWRMVTPRVPYTRSYRRCGRLLQPNPGSSEP